MSLDGVLLDPFKRFVATFIAAGIESLPDRKLIGAVYDGVPVGLSVVLMDEGRTSATIESIFIDAHYRRRGIGRRLLQVTEEEAFSAEPEVRMEANWLTDSRSAVALEKLFLCRNWSIPKEVSRIYRYRASGIAHFLSNTKTRDLGAGFEFFSWKDRNSADDEAIKNLPVEHDIGRGLSPDGEDYLPVDEEKSVGLRWRGDLVAWMILHRYGADLTRYTSLWIEPSMEGRGYGIATAAESCRRHLETMRDDQMGFFVTAVRNQQMQRFIRRRLDGGFHSISPMVNTKKSRADPPA